MSLQMHVEFTGASPAKVRGLAQHAQGLGLPVSYCRTPHPAISLDEAHAALTDQADWNAQYWDMDTAARLRLDGALRALYQIAPSDILVWAIWSGDRVAEERSVSLEELSEIVRDGRLETRTRYHVPKNS